MANGWRPGQMAGAGPIRQEARLPLREETVTSAGPLRAALARAEERPGKITIVGKPAIRPEVMAHCAVSWCAPFGSLPFHPDEGWAGQSGHQSHVCLLWAIGRPGVGVDPDTQHRSTSRKCGPLTATPIWGRRMVFPLLDAMESDGYTCHVGK